MKLMEILEADAVILDLGAQGKRDVLAEMAAGVAKAQPRIDAEQRLAGLGVDDLLRPVVHSLVQNAGAHGPGGPLPGSNCSPTSRPRAPFISPSRTTRASAPCRPCARSRSRRLSRDSYRSLGAGTSSRRRRPSARSISVT